MKKSNKGISMISLIITIIVTVLLATMALSTGTRYLKDSKTKEKENFINVLSSAIYRRREDANINSLAYPYIGYYIDNKLVFETIFAPKVKENVSFDDGIWYVVDSSVATSLGVKEVEKYIGSIDTTADDEKVKVALVDYKSAQVYLIDVSIHELSGFDVEKDDFVTGHKHRYLEDEPTCTTPVKCADCGFILKEALGHLYDETTNATPYDEVSHYTKVCKRDGCGMTGGFAKHEFQIKQEVRDGDWYHNISCIDCTYQKLDEKCKVQYYMPESVADKNDYHVKYCPICDSTVNEEHIVAARRVSESIHELYCTVRQCNHTIERENHIDDDNDKICDKCGSDIIDYSYPQLTKVVISKKVANAEDNKYFAKYGDTLVMEIVADKKIQNLAITIGGVTVSNSAITTTDQQTWNVEFYIDSTMRIANGTMKITINCESTVGVALPSTVVSTTDNNMVTFDATSPSVEYINKSNRVDE